MVAKSDHIIEMDGDFVGDLKSYAIVAIPQHDCSIIMLPMMQIHKYVAKKNPTMLIHKIICSRKLLVIIQIQTSIVAKKSSNNATSRDGRSR
jgi:hypothetical protein